MLPTKQNIVSYQPELLLVLHFFLYLVFTFNRQVCSTNLLAILVELGAYGMDMGQW